MSVTIGKALTTATTRLSWAGITTARLDALLLLEYVAKIDRSWLLAHGNRSMSQATTVKFQTALKQRAQRIPLAYITKSREFYSLTFKVTPAVLIPRTETEALVEAALAIKKPRASVLDVGTGCGAIAVAIAKERPQWQVTASDISAKALKVAGSNARKHGVKIDFVKSNLFENISGSFDIIAANLPYVKNRQKISPETKHEPAAALFGGQDGLNYYRHFFKQVPLYSKPNGLVTIEADPREHAELIRIAGQYHLQSRTVTGWVLSFAAR